MVPTTVNMEDIEIANNLFLEKKFSLAIDEYSKILENDPENLSALNNMGYTLTKLKKFDQALECYEKSLEIQGNDHIVLINKISLFRKTGKVEDALKLCNEILKKCQIDKTKTGLSYDLMKKTGNTGAVSSLQFINECVNKKELSKNQLGCFVDYGWEGVNLFMFKKLSKT